VAAAKLRNAAFASPQLALNHAPRFKRDAFRTADRTGVLFVSSDYIISCPRNTVAGIAARVSKTVEVSRFPIVLGQQGLPENGQSVVVALPNTCPNMPGVSGTFGDLQRDFALGSPGIFF